MPEWISYIEWSFSRATDIAVPMFFLISGFFFFRSDYGRWGSYKQMIIKKYRTLLIPFIVWNILGFFILWGCHVIMMPESIVEFLIGLFMSEYDGALWYVRNLMLMMLIVPVYGFMFHIRRGTYLVIPVVAILLWVWWPVDCSITSYEGWLFFLLGGALQKYAPSLNVPMKREFAVIGGIVWIVLCLFHYYGGLWMAKFTILFGIVMFWCLCDCIPGGWTQKLVQYTKYSFFIYVTHIFVMKTLKVGTAHFFFKDNVAAIIAYVTIPIVCFITLLKIGVLFNKYAPKLFMVLTGGRG